MIVAEDKKIKKCPVSLQPDIENLLQDLSPDDFASASRQEKDDFIQDRQSVSYWKDAWRRLKKNVVAMVALGVIVFLFLFAFVGPLLIPYGYDEFNKGAENLYPYHYTLEDTQRVNDEIVSRTQSDVVDVDEMIAQAKAEAEKKGEKFTKKDEAVIRAKAKVAAKMEELRVADAMTEIFGLFKRCNKYIDETMPWALAKDEAKKDRLEEVLYNLVESITIGACLLESFMPETTEKILAQLNAEKRSYEELDQFGLYTSGNQVTDQPQILFQRLDVKEVMEKVEVIQAKQKAAMAAASGEEEKEEEAVIDLEPKEEITFDDFGKMQFQVGEIISCEPVKKSKKLLCFQVKVGSQVRQIVSGIKAYYKPEDTIGMKVMVLTNLKPAKLAGMMSEGMLLCAEDAEGNVCLMTPEKAMPAGAEIC